MPLTYLILRVLHIVSGTLWVGAAVFVAWMVEPAVHATGPAGGAFMQRLAGPGRLSLYMAASALVTTVTGLFLLWPVSGHLSAAWMTSAHGLSLGLGSLAGILAVILGVTVNSPTANRIGALGREIQAAGGAPTVEQRDTMSRLQHRLSLGGRAGAVLLLLSTIGMAAAKYVG